MGFLDKLWDETLAGPTPEYGLGKLRKYDSFKHVGGRSHHHRYHSRDDLHIPVSRSITLLHSRSLTMDRRSGSSSIPSSPAGSCSTGTNSPLSPGTPSEDYKKLTRKKLEHPADHRSSTVYDWIVVTSLDP